MKFMRSSLARELAGLFVNMYWNFPPALGTIISRISSCQLNRKTCKSLEELVDLAFSFKFIPFAPMKPYFAPFSITPAQVREEILELLKVLMQYMPRSILEIGTARGGTLFLFSRVASPDAIIISIDLPGGPFGGGYPMWKIPIYRSFALPGQKLSLIREDSHDLRTLKIVKEILEGRKLDFLFIDGDHTYEGVKRDFEMYGPLVRKGRIIALHDIVPGPPQLVGGVPGFWNEIKQGYRYQEIVKDWNQRGFGIGVIYT
jgi:predicted O-methyltransferase YrrM